MQEEERDSPEETIDQPRGWLHSVWMVFRNISLSLVTLILLLFLLVQVPVIQNWLVQRVTKTLSETLQTTVSLDYIRLAFFDKFRLEGLYVEDFYGDTLLYSQTLRADIVLNPIVLYRQGLVIEEVTLIDTRMHVRRLEGEYEDNMQQMVAALFPRDTTEERRPFQLNLGEINLRRVRFMKEDAMKGSTLDTYVEGGAIIVNKLDIPNKIVDVRTINIVDPVISIENREAAPGVDSLYAYDLLQDSLAAMYDSTFLNISVNQFYLNNGRFSLHNYRKAPRKMTPDDQLDYQHLEVFDIGVNIADFKVRDWNFSGRINNITAQESSGFMLNELSADSAAVTHQEVALLGLNLVTPYSNLGDTLILRYGDYPDFGEFPDRVVMDLGFNDAAIAVRDILVFAPGLAGNMFFSNNRNQRLRMNGRVSGRINNLRGRDLNIALADGTQLVGNFSSRNLAVRNEEFLNLRLERLRTNMSTLRQIIPGFDPPPNFDKLGYLNFSGSFDGFFVDFVADGVLNTALGRAEMDMQMRLADGLEQASYSGSLTLDNFDLGGWTGDTAFGTVTLASEVEDGRGLTAESASATLTSTIDHFFYKGYEYQNARLEGKLELNQFDGDFNIADDNIDFSFQGSIDLSNDVPIYRFNADIKELDLLSLNLSKEDIVLSGQVELNLRNRRLSDLRGTARFSSFRVQHDQTEVYEIDTLSVVSKLDSLGNREFTVDSDIMQAALEGNFDIQQVPEVLVQFVERNYPAFAKNLGIKAGSQDLSASHFSFDIFLENSKGLQRLVDGNLGPLQEVSLKGNYRGADDSLVADLFFKHFEFGSFSFRNVLIAAEGKGRFGEINLAVDSTILNDKTRFAPLVLIGILKNDSLAFDINYAGSGDDLVDNLNLNGLLFAIDSTYMQLEFNRSNLVLMEQTWDIEEPNYLKFGNNSIETRNLALSRGDKTITIENLGRRGLNLGMKNLDFGFINTIWDYEPLNFNGDYDLQATVTDVFKMQDIHASVSSDTMYINGDDWGHFRLDVEAEDLKHPFQGYLSLTKDTSQMIAKGFFNPQDLVADNPSLEEQQNYFDFSVDIAGFPLRMGEYFIGETVENTVGSFDADLRFYGVPPNTNSEGMIYAHKGAVTIDFLQTRYTFNESNIKVNNRLFDLTGTILYDKFGHTATVFGGVSHRNLRDMGFQARLETDRFLAIDTDIDDNNTFYGQAIGQGLIRFSGSFKRPDIYISATVGDSTILTIPVGASAGASELSFIRFVDKSESSASSDNSAELRGVELEMDLVVTEEATVRIVFDEQAGDIIEGSGRGSIRMLVPRSSDEFQMFGDYTISDGTYLFTLYSVVNKNFSIRQGGTIEWSGDPFAAEIDLEAEYVGVNTSVASFISEYLVSADADLKNQASQSTDVNLIMKLSGELLQPIIDFDINFPSLRGQLQNLTDSKLRLLKQDQNELNKQVFGLILAGQFIPADVNTFTGSEIIYNTVSEFFSNQLSLLLTELFSEFIEDGDVLSGIDFDIAYNQYQNVDLGDGQDINRGDELQVSLRQQFFNDRLSILVGGNIDMGTTAAATPEAAGAFVGNDLVIEYVLNRDRSLKLRVYQLLEPDIGGGRRLEIGTGLSYRKEFDSFNDFLKSLQRSVGLSKKKPDS